MTPLDFLVEMLTNDPAQARRLARAHRLDPDGRCVSCHSDGPSSGRTMGCTLGAAARKVLRDRKR